MKQYIQKEYTFIIYFGFRFKNNINSIYKRTHSYPSYCQGGERIRNNDDFKNTPVILIYYRNIFSMAYCLVADGATGGRPFLKCTWIENGWRLRVGFAMGAHKEHRGEAEVGIEQWVWEIENDNE